MFDLVLPASIGVVLLVPSWQAQLAVAGGPVQRWADRHSQGLAASGAGGQFMIGLLLGAVWSPCVGPTLGAASLLASQGRVERSKKDSLITKDRMRVDIDAEFYVRVKPDVDSIALAAQTLGAVTNNAELLRDQVEAKFVDGLRSVSATMELLELQEKRSDFVKHVQAAVEADVQSNGLELESVSLTKLDQTDISFFNAENFFDAEGLTLLKTVTETRRRDRNAIVRDNEVAIAQKDLEARQLTLQIERTKKEAELSQERDIANKTASTRAEVASATQTAWQTEENARIRGSRSARRRR